MHRTVEGKRFSIRKELPPAYRAIHSQVLETASGEIAELKTLFSKQSVSAEERKRIPVLLHSVGKLIFQQVGEKIERMDIHPILVDEQGPLQFFFAQNPYDVVSRFEKEFHHVPPDMTSILNAVRVACVANAIAQNVLLEEFGGSKVGVFSLPGHVVPSIKVHGTTYVLDVNLLAHQGFSKALTAKEYFKELCAAHGEPNSKHPLHRLAMTLYGRKNPLPSVFSSQSRYAGGLSASVAGAHYNLAYHFASMGDDRRMLREYARAAELDPSNGDVHFMLGRFHLAKGNLTESELPLSKAISLGTSDPNVYGLMAGLLHRLDRHEEEKEHLKMASRLAKKYGLKRST